MYRVLARTFRDEKRRLAIIAFLSIVSAGTEAAALISIAPLIQTASEGRSGYEGSVGPWNLELTLTELASIAAALLVVALVVQLVAVYVSAKLVTGYQLRKRLEVVRAFQNSDWGVQAQEREGWLQTLSSANVGAASDGLQATANWLKGSIGMSIFLIGAVVLNFVAVLVITMALGLVVLALRPLNKYVRKLSQQVAVLNVQVSEELATLTMTARELRLYGVVPEASRRYIERAREHRASMVHSSFGGNIGAPIFRSAAALLIVGMVAVSVTSGSSDIASVGIVAVLLYRSSNYGTVLVGVHQRLVAIVPSIDQLDEGLQKLWSNQIEVGNVEPQHVKSIDATSVTFTYPGQPSPAIDRVSLRVGVDEVVGIVGPSGGGKSTLAELLVGLRRPTSGLVAFDGIEMSDVSDPARSSCVALVSQHVPLIPATVRENIKFFREVDDATIDEAIEAAGLSSTVAEMPDGSDTLVGPGLRALSGGQAQRLGLARALAGQPSIVVLDEPTSALDAVSEEVVIETIGALRGRVGVVVIAHRLTTLRYCNRIVILENGKVTDDGSMTDLRQRNAYLAHAFEIGQLT